MTTAKRRRGQARNNRTKGRQFEFWCRDVIARGVGLPCEAVRVRSKSAAGCDVWADSAGFPYCVEAKNRQRLNVFRAYDQAMANTYEGLSPAVFCHRGRLYLATEDLFLFLAKLALLQSAYGVDWYRLAMEKAGAIKEEAPSIKEARLECRPKGGGGEHAKSERPSG